MLDMASQSLPCGGYRSASAAQEGTSLSFLL